MSACLFFLSCPWICLAVCTEGWNRRFPHFPCLSPKILKKHHLLISLRTMHCITHEKLKTTVMQRFGGQTRCIMGDMQMVNGQFWNWLVHNRGWYKVLKLLVCSFHHDSYVDKKNKSIFLHWVTTNFVTKLSCFVNKNMHGILVCQQTCMVPRGWKFIKKGPFNEVWVRKCMHVVVYWSP